MAVMYSKLGGCLGGNCKVRSFSQDRPLSWCQRFVGKVNDPLRVRFFIGRNLGGLLEGGGSVTFPGGSIDLLGGLCGPIVGGCLLHCLEALVGLLPWPAWVDLREWEGSTAWEELLPSPKGGRAVTWGEAVAREAQASLGGRVVTSLGGRVVAREVLASPGGKVVAGDALASPGGGVLAWEGIVPSPGVMAVAWGGYLPGKEWFLPW